VPASAHDKWGNNFGVKYKIPHAHAPSIGVSSGGGSTSGLTVMSYAKKYNWSLKNESPWTITYRLDGKKYKLAANSTTTFTSKVGVDSSNSNNGTRYREPSISFDRYGNDERYTKKTFTVDVTKKSRFVFWKDGNILKFSAR